MNALIQREGKLLAPQLDYILIDGSSSMSDKWWPTMAGLDGFLAVLQSQNIHSHGIVSVFSSRDLQSIQRDSEIATWPRFVDAALGSQFGTTPLYDAINLMGRHLRTLDPPKASIVIVTDGDENASRHTDATQARAIVNWMTAKGWQITWFGCDFNNARQAALLGAAPRNTVGVRQAKLTQAGHTLGEKRVRNIHYGADIVFTDDEKENFGGYLSHG